MVGIEPTIYYLSVCVYLLTTIIFPILCCKNTIHFFIKQLFMSYFFNNAKAIADVITRAPKEIEKAMRDELPRKAAIIAKNHFKQNFRNAGFMDNGLHSWKRTRRQEEGDQRKPLRSRRNHLMNSIETVPAPGQVTVTNPVPYARIHNEGGNISTHPTVTPKMRKMAWAKVYALAGVKGKGKLPQKLPPQARKWMALALTKKSKLHIKARIPQRKFIGKSKELRQRLNKMILDKLKQIQNGISIR